MPKKPEKSVKGTSGVSMSDTDFIGQRKMAIDKWLQGLASLPRVVYIPHFVEFFGLPYIRPKYCGSHIVFAQATSLAAPAQRVTEIASPTNESGEPDDTNEQDSKKDNDAESDSDDDDANNDKAAEKPKGTCRFQLNHFFVLSTPSNSFLFPLDMLRF